MIALALIQMAPPQTGTHPTPILLLTLLLLFPTLNQPPHLPIRSRLAPLAHFPVLRPQPFCLVPICDHVEVLFLNIQLNPPCLTPILLCQKLSQPPLPPALRHLSTTPQFPVLLLQLNLLHSNIGGLQGIYHVDGPMTSSPVLNRVDPNGSSSNLVPYSGLI